MTLCLIVDDDMINRSILSEALNELDLTFEEAADGVEAIDKCKEQMPDIIILDWMMPNMDGMEFLNELKNVPNGDHPYIVLCTAKDNIENILEGIRNGADTYVVKPFNIEFIAKKIQDALIKKDEELDLDE